MKRRTNCRFCDQIIPDGLFQFCSKECKRKNINKKHSKKNYYNRKLAAITIKKRFVDMMGGKCKYCGYNKCLRSLVFHHINPSEKMFVLNMTSFRTYPVKKLLEELKKTELVCCNCHRELHFKGKQKWLVKTKQILVERKGSKCYKCDYNKCYAALDFHHIDPNTKNKELHLNSNLYKNQLNTKEVLDELDKCILLCANCHQEHHHISDKTPSVEEAHKYVNRIKRIPVLCKRCNKEIKNDYHTTRIYCSRKCHHIDKNKYTCPTEELNLDNLREEIKLSNIKTVAEKYNINRLILGKWLKRNYILKPD